jgi:dCTP deaminase
MIQVDPQVDPENIRPVGIRLHLGAHLLEPSSSQTTIDLAGEKEPEFNEVCIGSEGYVLSRGKFVLGASVEHVRLDPDIVCLVDGRSTLARVGLLVHCGAMTFDHIQGEARSVTFELANIGPFDVILRAGSPIALLLFARLSSAVQQAPNPQYMGQSKPTPPTIGYVRRI